MSAGWNIAQRVVIVIALAAALLVFGLWLTHLGSERVGWFGYAPLRSIPPVARGGIPGWARMLIWLALVAAWAVPSFFLLRSKRDTTS